MKTYGRYLSIFLLGFSSVTLAATTVDSSTVPEKKRSKLGMYLTAQEAYKITNDHPEQALFVDVRTRAEVNFLGTAANIDANVPYMEINEWYAWNDKSESFKLDVNADFAKEIEKRLKEKHLTKNDTVVLMCRSGDRSARAADLLADLGYKKVYSVIEGFEGDMSKEGQRNVNGWKNANLPWSYKLAKTKMYFSAQQ